MIINGLKNLSKGFKAVLRGVVLLFTYDYNYIFSSECLFILI